MFKLPIEKQIQNRLKKFKNYDHYIEETETNLKRKLKSESINPALLITQFSPNRSINGYNYFFQPNVEKINKFLN